MKYLTVDQILAIHAREIARFGGDPGIRDRGLVESAVAQPRQTFGGQPLYPTLEEKAVALAFSLIKNHAFVDGNKRVGAAALLMFLGRNGCTLQASVDEMESTVVKVAAGELDRLAFLAWVRVRHVRKTTP